MKRLGILLIAVTFFSCKENTLNQEQVNSPTQQHQYTDDDMKMIAGKASKDFVKNQLKSEGVNDASIDFVVPVHPLGDNTFIVTDIIYGVDGSVGQVTCKVKCTGEPMVFEHWECLSMYAGGKKIK